MHLGPHPFEIAVQLREMAGGGAGGGEPGGELLRRELGESEGGGGGGKSSTQRNMKHLPGHLDRYKYVFYK